jgi:hypothetical protein
VVVGDRVDVEFDKYYSATVQKLKKGQFLALFADGEEVWVTMAANVGVAICDLRIEHYYVCMNVSSVLTSMFAQEVDPARTEGVPLRRSSKRLLSNHLEL